MSGKHARFGVTARVSLQCTNTLYVFLKSLTHTRTRVRPLRPAVSYTRWWTQSRRTRVRTHARGGYTREYCSRAFVRRPDWGRNGARGNQRARQGRGGSKSENERETAEVSRGTRKLRAPQVSERAGGRKGKRVREASGRRRKLGPEALSQPRLPGLCRVCTLSSRYGKGYTRYSLSADCGSRAERGSVSPSPHPSFRPVGRGLLLLPACTCTADRGADPLPWLPTPRNYRPTPIPREFLPFATKRVRLRRSLP